MALIIVSLAFLSAPASGQFDYIELSTIQYNHNQFLIKDPVIQTVKETEFRVFCSIENTGLTEISGLHIWVMIYFEDSDDPTRYEYKEVTRILPDSTVNFFWAVTENPGKTPISGLIVPFRIGYSDNTMWSLDDQYSSRPRTFTAPDRPLKYPEIGYVTSVLDSVGLISSGSVNGIKDGQLLLVTRSTEESFTDAARIRVIRNLPTRSGFSVERQFPGEKIRVSNRVRLLFPGMARLHSTSKALLFFSGLSGTAAGFYHMKDGSNNKRDAALLSAGLSAGTAAISELIFGRTGPHLYPGETGRFFPSNWNTTTRTFLTMGALSLGSAVYYINQRNYAENRLDEISSASKIEYYNRKATTARNRRDISLVLAGTAITSGIINQFLGNKWPYSATEGSRYSPGNWHPVTRSFAVMSANALISGLYFNNRRNNAEDKYLSASDEAERLVYESDKRRYGNWRDTALLTGGSALLAGIMNELYFSKNDNEIFQERSPFSLPSIPKPTWYMLGFTATSGYLSFYFDKQIKLNESRLIETDDEAEKQVYRDKINAKKSSRDHALIVAGLSTAGTILSYLIERKSSPPAENNGNSGSISFSPSFNSRSTGIGLTVKF